MSALFADTGYWVALLDDNDDLRLRVAAIRDRVAVSEIVTTEMVLDEVLANVSGQGVNARSQAVELIRAMNRSPRIEVVPQTTEQFHAAMELYANRLDQSWSLTDCSSFVLMEERGISEALAYDRDFEQAGFVALLRDDSG